MIEWRYSPIETEGPNLDYIVIVNNNEVGVVR